MTRLSKLAVLLALLPVAVSFAESEKQRQAREDLERQLKSMVGTPPTKVRIDFVGLDQPNYELLEATFELDGHSLPVSDLKSLSADGDHLIFHGDVTPGEHRLETRLHFENKASPVVSQEGGFKWKPGSMVAFRAESGIEVQLKVTPELDPSAELKKRIKVSTPATVKMLAKLDDGTMPDPLERPKIVLAAPDAGVELVKGPSGAEKAAAVAEARRKAREEALAAKQAAIEERKRLAEEAKAGRLAAAEERKRALEEKRRNAPEPASKHAVAGAAKVPGDEAPAPAAVEPDAGAVEIEAAVAQADAGSVEVAAMPPEPPKKIEATPVAPEESGLPLPVLIGLGLAVLGLVLFVVARSRGKPPKDF
jgi:hypothetical protein